MAQDYDEALTFMTPSYQNSPRAERFRGTLAARAFWQDAEIKWVKCDDEDALLSSVLKKAVCSAVLLNAAIR